MSECTCSYTGNSPVMYFIFLPYAQISGFCFFMAALPNTGGAVCVNAAVWLCSNVAKTRNPLKLAGCPKLTKRSQPLVGRSSPYCKDVREILLLNKFFPIVDTCLSCKDIVRHICGMVPTWRFLATFWVLHLQRASCSTFQTCILNPH